MTNTFAILDTLTIAPRPRGGDWLDADIRHWAKSGISTVVSLLEPHEAMEFDLDGEAAACAASNMNFESFPIADRSVPEWMSVFAHKVEVLHERIAKGEHVLIHCRQGIGRAGMLAAAILIESGMSATEAVAKVSAARRLKVPETAEQLQWLERYAKSRALPIPI